MGNYDINNFSDLDLFSDTDFRLLNCDTVELKKDGETFNVSGINLAELYKHGGVLKNIPKDNYSVFLCHYSNLIESLDNYNVDLYLCGHTHGGQICLPFYGAIITLSKFGKKYESGMYRMGATVLYVNRGIGLEGSAVAPRVRFLSKPEITVFNIIPKN